MYDCELPSNTMTEVIKTYNTAYDRLISTIKTEIFAQSFFKVWEPSCI